MMWIQMAYKKEQVTSKLQTQAIADKSVAMPRCRAKSNFNAEGAV